MSLLKYTYTFIFLICSTFHSVSFCQTSKDIENHAERLDSLFTLSNQRGLLNGSVLISQKGKLIYEKSFGFKNEKQKENLHNHSIYNIGSIAKEFNGVALMMLVESGKISLQDPISKFGLNLPAWSQKVKIIHLLNYTSGMPLIDQWDTTSDEIAWQKLRATDTLLFEPGTQFKYDNSNVFIQKRIIEQVSGISFNSFIVEHIITPLDLKNTHMDPKENLNNLTSCFDLDLTACPKFEFISGWPWLDMYDLHTWIHALNTHKLISKSSYDELIKNPFFEGKTANLGEYFEKDSLHRHNGTSFNFESIVLNDRKNDIIIIILSNQRNIVWNIGHEALRVMHGNTPRIPKKSVYHALRKECLENIDNGIRKYYKLKLQYKDEYAFQDPAELNRLGYFLIKKDKIEDALSIFKLALIEFPNNANLYDSYGEALYLNKQYYLSVSNYQKSLDLNPNNKNAIEMIEKIKKQIPK